MIVRPKTRRILAVAADGIALYLKTFVTALNEGWREVRGGRRIRCIVPAKVERKQRFAPAIVRADDAIDGNRSADPEEIVRTRWQHLASRDQGKIVDGCEVLIDFCAWPIDHPVGPVDPTLIEGPVETRSRMTLPGRIVGHPSSRCGEFPTARVACGVTG